MRLKFSLYLQNTFFEEKKIIFAPTFGGLPLVGAPGNGLSWLSLGLVLEAEYATRVILSVTTNPIT